VVKSSPAAVNGVVYIGSLDHNVYALNATNGAKLWNYRTDGTVYSSPAVVDSVVYVGSEDGNIYALNASSGVKLWSYHTNGYVESSPAVVGVVYIGSLDGKVYALTSPLKPPNTLFGVILAVAVVVIVASVAFVIIRKRLKAN
jgi:outer membrane protein assembly factor BamB